MSERTRTDEEVVADCNDLAREFYKLHGYDVPAGYRFDQATHPQELSMWQMAMVAYDKCTGTDVEDALTSLDG